MGPTANKDRAVRDAVALFDASGRGEVFWLEPTGVLRWTRWPDGGRTPQTHKVKRRVIGFSVAGGARQVHLVCATAEGEVSWGLLREEVWTWFSLLSFAATHEFIARLILLPAPGEDLLLLVLARARATRRWEVLTYRLRGEPDAGALVLRRAGVVRLPALPEGPAPLQALYQAWVPSVAAALGRDGTLHVLYVHPEADGRMGLHLLSRHARGVKWQHRRLPVRGSAAHPHLACDGTGTVWAAWKEGDEGGFRYGIMPLKEEPSGPPLVVAAGDATDYAPSLEPLGDGVGFLCHDGSRWRLFRATFGQGSPAACAQEVALPDAVASARPLWLAASQDGSPVLLQIPQTASAGAVPVILRVADAVPEEGPVMTARGAEPAHLFAWPWEGKGKRRFRPVAHACRARRPRLVAMLSLIAVAVWTAAALAGSEPVARALTPPYVVQAVPVRDAVEIRGTAEPPRTIVVRAPRAGRVDRVWARAGARVAAGEALVALADPELEAERNRLLYRKAFLLLERDALAAEREWTLHAPVRGSVIEVRVVPGDPVHKGQVVVRLRDSAARSAVDLTAVRDGVVRQVHVARHDRVVRGSPLVTVEHPPATLAWKKARLALEQTEQELAALARRERENTITAPQAGTVIEVKKAPGSAVVAGEPLVVLREREEVRVIADLDKAWSALVRPGQPVRVWAEGNAKGPLAGTVQEVRPKPPESDRVTLVAAVPLSPTETDLLAGTVTVQVIVPRCASCLAIPAAYLHGDGDQPYVHLRLPGGRVIRQRVTVGVRGGGLVEIRHGVEPGDVLLP